MKSPIHFDPSAGGGDKQAVRLLFGSKAASAATTAHQIGISPQLEDKVPVGSRSRNQENSYLPFPKKLLKPGMHSMAGVGRPRGKGAALPGKRGPFRALNGLSSRRQEEDKKVRDVRARCSE